MAHERGGDSRNPRGEAGRAAARASSKPSMDVCRGRSPARSGRAAALLLVFVVAAAALMATRAQQPASERAAGLRAETGSASGEARSVEGYAASTSEGSIRLEPLCADEAQQRWRAASLRARLALEEGEPWRLVLPLSWLSGSPGSQHEAEAPSAADSERASQRQGAVDAALLGSLSVSGATAAALRPLALLCDASEPLGRALSRVETTEDGRVAVLLWGRRPDAPVLHVAARRQALQAARLETAMSVQSSPASGSSAGPGTGRGDGALPSRAALAAENERLRHALEQERTRRGERERAWYDFNRTLAELRIAPDDVRFDVDEELVPEAAEARREREEAAASPGAADPEGTGEPERDPLAERGEEVLRSVRAFLVMGDLQSYDLLELGPPRLGAPLGGAGPALFRILDDRGRLAGSLHAELLRFEGSRSGRTVTLVLEEGYESHGGIRTPFSDGMRRIPVPFLDPEPWHEALPELFPPGAFADVEDDGRWDREALRRDLNDLLARDTSLGWYRVRGLGGVVGEQLTDLHLEVLDESGRLSRRLFADRAWLEVEPPGMVLRMESGVILRGERKEAFRNGRYDVYLPRARPQEWRAAGLPGLTEEDAPVEGREAARGDEESRERTDD